MVSIETISNNFVAPWIKALAKYWKWILLALLFLFLLIVVVVGVFAGPGAALIVLAVGAAAAAAIWPVIKKLLQQAQAADDLTITGMTPAAVAQAPPATRHGACSGEVGSRQMAVGRRHA